MLDIGPIHRHEYEQDSRAGGVFASKEKSGKDGGISPEADQVVIAQAPGRINFLGEHGDPSANLYLSAAINRWISIAVSARKDNSLRFYAVDLGERKRATLVNLKYKREDRWANYIKTAIYLFADMGFPVKGMNFTVSGDIPLQIGLASSSAIEVAAAVALRGFLRVKMGDRDLVDRLAAAHLKFYGTPPHTADYLIGLFAQNDHFLLVDEANLSVTRVKSPFSRCKIILVDSRVPRFGIESELDVRRQDVNTALEILSRDNEGASFREFAALDLMESMGNLPEEIRRRSLYVVQEIRRVMSAKDYLLRSDFSGFSRIIFNSHEGLRDLYEVSCPEIDWMVKRAQETVGVLGARMTGPGFGGCTYAIVKNEAAMEYRTRIDDYERIFGFRPAVYEVKIATGSKVVKDANKQAQH